MSGPVYQIINLPEGADTNEFERYMLDTVFPAVPRGPTRLGGIDDLQLFKDCAGSNTYIWVIQWSGLSNGERFLLRRLPDEIKAELSNYGVVLQPVDRDEADEPEPE